jgi:hypothetical protein
LIVLGVVLIVWLLSGATPASAGDPNAPTLNGVTVAPDGKVTVSWTDNSTGEDGFSVHRMETVGQFPNQWHSVGDLATRNRPGTGGSYTYTDASSFTTSDGERCFRVAAYDNAGGLDAISTERCVTAPKPVSATSQPAPPAAGSGSSHPAATAAPGGPGGLTHPSTTASPGSASHSATNAGAPGAAVVRGGDSDRSTSDEGAVAAKPPSRSGMSTSTKVVTMAIVGTVTVALALVALAMEWSRRRRVAARAATHVATPATSPAPPTTSPAPPTTSPASPAIGPAPPADPWRPHDG